MAASRTLTDPPTKAAHRPFKPDMHYITAALVILTSVVLGVIVLGDRSDTRGILVAARDLPVGTMLGPRDVIEAQVRMDDTLYAVVLPSSLATELVGRQLVEPVHARQILVQAQIGNGPLLKPDEVAMSISVKNESAAGGKIRVGDTVRVIATANKSQPNSQTSIVVDRATVYGVGRDERVGAISSSGDTARDSNGPLTSLTLIVTADQALQVAIAKHGGELDVVLLPPSSAPHREGTPGPSRTPIAP